MSTESESMTLGLAHESPVLQMNTEEKIRSTRVETTKTKKTSKTTAIRKTKKTRNPSCVHRRKVKG